MKSGGFGLIVGGSLVDRSRSKLMQLWEQRMGDAMVQFVQIIEEFFSACFGSLALGSDTIGARLEATVHAVNLWLGFAFLLQEKNGRAKSFNLWWKGTTFTLTRRTACGSTSSASSSALTDGIRDLMNLSIFCNLWGYFYWVLRGAAENITYCTFLLHVTKQLTGPSEYKIEFHTHCIYACMCVWENCENWKIAVGINKSSFTIELWKENFCWRICVKAS